jgi:hypothetical protein
MLRDPQLRTTSRRQRVHRRPLRTVAQLADQPLLTHHSREFVAVDVDVAAAELPGNSSAEPPGPALSVPPR